MGGCWRVARVSAHAESIIMSVYAFIFARGGSKRIPEKNLRCLGGKTLLEWSIDLGQKISQIERIFVSTDCPKIAQVAEERSVSIIERPSTLAQDDSPEWLSWRHAVEHVTDRVGQFDVFISLPTTSPLRQESDVLACLTKLDCDTDIVVTVTEPRRSPWFNMVKSDEKNNLSLLYSENCVEENGRLEIYDMTTVAYVTRPSYILKNKQIWDGRVRGVKIPPERAVDIDTPLDFAFAASIVSQKSSK